MALIGILIACVGFVFVLKGFFVRKEDGLKQDIINTKENISRVFGLGFIIAGYGLYQQEAFILQNLLWIVGGLFLVMFWNIAILFQQMSKYNDYKENVMAENLKVFAQSLKKQQPNDENSNKQ